ncbi:hypothetical protein KUV62_08185 [Salipiger bermudensis]|uniref:hypothetical protein n=1 Tax=Salipiger bermudensis TaxID=344736 RepID=UPI001C99F15B|nr:hypothetical protein [Salipiger bermudensis]MBY6003881.1 hypothetical protein [Salipiger bermudensis]
MSRTAFSRCFCAVLPLLALLAGAVIAPTEAGAQVSHRLASVHVVGNDRGGRLQPRLAEIRQLRSQGVRVEIRGNFCLSSCTLYLGAGDVCVASNTRFGFHGPYYRFKPISPDRFDYWSRRMAEHYPAPLRDWFLSEARFVSNGYVSLSGAELIRMGVPRC